MDIPMVLMTSLLASLPNWGGFILLYASNNRTIRKLFASVDNLISMQHIALDKRVAVLEGQVSIIQDLFKMLIGEYRHRTSFDPLVADEPTVILSDREKGAAGAERFSAAPAQEGRAEDGVKTGTAGGW